MLLKTLLICTVGICAVSTADVVEVKEKPEPYSTTIVPPTPPTTSTTAKPTTTSTTVAPNTTTTSTTPATTTTSTTAAPTTTSTTTAPKTTTVKPRPLPPAPKPVEPKTGTWRINYTDANASCIISQMAIQIQIPYDTTNNTKSNGYLDIPVNASATGECKVESASLELKWLNNTITFEFVNNTNTYGLKRINLNITPDVTDFPDDKSNKTIVLVHKVFEFNTTRHKSYKCAKAQTLNLTEANTNNTFGYLHLRDVHVQAFGDKKTTGFYEAVDCEPFGTPDIVPIAAGCALVALIVIVLGAYLIGRRRSRALGYVSMFSERNNKREEDYIPMKNLSCFN